MSQPKYDSIWKALPDAVLLALIRLALPEVEGNIEQWKTNLKVLIDREADNTYLVVLNGVRVLVHLEYQNYLDDTMPLRMFHYVVSLKMSYYQQYQEDIPVIGIVIWARRGKTPAPIYQSGIDADHGLVYQYHEIHLHRTDWHDVDPILLVLAPFLRGVNRQNAVSIGAQMYESSPPEYRNLLLGALFNLMERSYKDIDDIEQAILQQVRVTMDEIIDAIQNGRWGRLIEERATAKGIAQGMAQGIAQGKAEGIAQGKAEGKTEGKAEATAKAVVILWKVRFGSVDADVQAALATADAARLDAVLDAFAANPTEADLRALLGMSASA